MTTPTLPPDLLKKQQTLRAHLRQLGSLLIAFSGGVDSSLLLAETIHTLGPQNTLAVTLDTPLIPREEIDTAVQITRALGSPHLILPFNILAQPNVAANPPDRCYHCKRTLFTVLKELATDHGLAHIAHGANRDDLNDYRPGMRATEELQIQAPLLDAGLTKADIRALARHHNLPIWDRPSNACLASRIPYHTPITPEALQRIENAEDWLRQTFHLTQLRVRDHYPIARIEVPPDTIPTLVEPTARQAIVETLRKLGYQHITIDLQGYRTGSMNDELNG